MASSGNIWVLVWFVGLHKCSRFPCCTQILRFESCSQTTFRWIWRLLNFRNSCCRITWWHINNLAADGSGRNEFQIVDLNWAKLYKLEARLNILASSLWLLLTCLCLPLSDLGHEESFHTIVLSEPMGIVIWKWHFPFWKCFAEEILTISTP